MREDGIRFYLAPACVNCLGAKACARINAGDRVSGGALGPAVLHELGQNPDLVI